MMLSNLLLIIEMTLARQWLTDPETPTKEIAISIRIFRLYKQYLSQVILSAKGLPAPGQSGTHKTVPAQNHCEGCN